MTSQQSAATDGDAGKGKKKKKGWVRFIVATHFLEKAYFLCKVSTKKIMRKQKVKIYTLLSQICSGKHGRDYVKS